MTNKTAQDKEQVVTFRLTTDELARLDRLADKAGVSRSQFVRNLIDVGMDEFETLQKLGIIRTALTVRDMLQWMSDKVKSAPEHIDKDVQDKA